MDRNQREAIWKAAFEILKPYTQKIRALPSSKILLQRATRAVRKATYNASIDIKVSRILAEDIARYIEKNWDQEKRRAAPKTSRAALTARNEQLVSTGRTSGLSVRKQASKSKISASQLSRIRREAGLSPKQDRVKASLSDGASTVMTFIESIVPANRVRAAKWKDFMSWVSPLFDPRDDQIEPQLLEHLAELSASRLGINFYRHKGFLIIARGRKLKEDEATRWLDRARPSSFIQRYSLLNNSSSLVWRDLLAVEVIIRQQARLDDWRVFIEASTFSELEAGVLRYYHASRISDLTSSQVEQVLNLTVTDRNAMLNRIARGLTKPTERDYLPAIRAWNRHYDTDYRALSFLLDIVDSLDGLASSEGIERWMDQTFYAERVHAGRLPGRKTEHIASFIEAMKESERED
jgi:hypothetical protein